MEPAGGGQRPAFIKKRDVIIVAALLCLALLGLLLWRATARPGAVAVVSIAYGEVSETREIPLSRDGVTDIEAALPVHLEVKDGAIRFVRAECPDHLCEEMGWLDAEGEWALCAPAGVLVSVREEGT